LGSIQKKNTTDMEFYLRKAKLLKQNSRMETQ